MRDGRDELVGVEVRRRGQHDNLARVDIHHDEGTATQRVVAQGLLGSFLPLQVKGGDDGAAGLGPGLQLVQDFIAAFIEHEPPDTGFAGELFIEFELQSGAAFLALENRVVVVDGTGGQLGLGTGVAQNVAGRCAGGVVADVEGDEMRMLNLLHFFAQRCQLVFADSRANGQRQPAAVAVVIQQLRIRLFQYLEAGCFIRGHGFACYAENVLLALILQLSEVDGRLVGHLGAGHHISFTVCYQPPRPRYGQ